MMEVLKTKDDEEKTFVRMKPEYRLMESGRSEQTPGLRRGSIVSPSRPPGRSPQSMTTSGTRCLTGRNQRWAFSRHTTDIFADPTPDTLHTDIILGVGRPKGVGM